MSENIQSEELVEKAETVVTTYGKVIEVGEVKETVTGTVVDKVQPVVIEIIEGDYIGEEFSTDYILSYDIEGKIIFGEMTFFDGSGFDNFNPEDWDYRIGSMFKLPEKR